MVIEKPKTYCDYVKDLPLDNVHRMYHDQHYGFPLESDDELFGRLILEINQAGLSWDTILKKEANFRKAYDSFEIVRVASYSQEDIDRLLSDKGIIRNKLKINAAIYNAQQILKLQKEHGSYKAWLNKNHPLGLENWVKLFKKTFKFTGGEITNEFLMSTGYLDGAHVPDCPIFHKIITENPMWMKSK